MTPFLMILQRFPKNFQNCSEGQTNVPEHFPRISENFRRCPKIFEDSYFVFMRGAGALELSELCSSDF